MVKNKVKSAGMLAGACIYAFLAAGIVLRWWTISPMGQVIVLLMAAVLSIIHAWRYLKQIPK